MVGMGSKEALERRGRIDPLRPVGPLVIVREVEKVSPFKCEL